MTPYLRLSLYQTTLMKALNNNYAVERTDIPQNSAECSPIETRKELAEK